MFADVLPSSTGLCCLCHWRHLYLAAMIGLAALLGDAWPCQEQTLRIRWIPSATPACASPPGVHLVAMFAVMLDVEPSISLPGPSPVFGGGWVGFISAYITLLVGLLCLWLVGALDWAPKSVS